MFAHGMFIFAKMHLYPMRKLHFGMYKDEIDNPPRGIVCEGDLEVLVCRHH